MEKILVYTLCEVSSWNDIVTRTFWVQFIKNLFGDMSGTHMGFMYQLIGMILTAPFLAKLARSLSDYEHILFIAVVMVYTVISTYFIPLLGMKMGYKGLLLGGWLFVFYLGYVQWKLVNEKNRKLVYCLGVVSFVVTLLQMKFVPDLFKGMYDTAPLQIVTTFAIFTALRQIGTKCKAGHKLIAKIGEHSFTIYLLHVLILTKIMHPLLVGISRWYLRMPIEFAGTLLVSYLMAEVFDSVVVRNLKKVENRKRNIEKSLDN